MDADTHRRLRAAAAADCTVGALPDEAVGDLLVTLWAQHSPGTAAAVILAQAIERLRRASGGPCVIGPDA